MNKIVLVSTVDEVKAEFAKRGVSVSEWARRHGVSAQLTYRVLDGRPALRGQTHRIAVLLGLKPGTADNAEDLRFEHRAPSDAGGSVEEAQPQQRAAA